MPNEAFFSVSYDYIVTDMPVPYDLFVNSSAREGHDRFVRVFPIGEVLASADIHKFKHKYGQLYIPETQRSLYLQSLTKSNALGDTQKTQVIKDSAIKYLDKIFDPGREFTTELLGETIEGCKDSVENMVEVIQDYDTQGLQNLIGSLSFHDFYTFDHSINVSMYCINIYKALRPGCSKEELTLCGLGGMLHDLGKIKIPTDIINFPGKLTDEMFGVIKQHPENGKKLIEEGGCQCEGVDIGVVKRVVYEHHENFNGTGYPNKLNGEDIHLMARVTAIADFFDAITTKRSYHDVLSVDEALHVMAKAKGKKLDPKIFDIFVKASKTMIKDGKMNVALPDSFDPCQPQEELPFEKVSKKKETKDYGKIKFMERNKPKKRSRSA